MNHDKASDSWVSFRFGTERFYAMRASGRNGLKILQLLVFLYFSDTFFSQNQERNKICYKLIKCVILFFGIISLCFIGRL